MSAPTRTAVQHPAEHERSAARRYLEHDYAAENLRGEPAREASRNATAIDEEHPRARDIALTGTARELGKLPAHLRAHQAHARHLAGISTQDAARIRREYRSGPYQAPADDDEHAKRRRLRDRARDSARQAAAGAAAAVPAAAGAVGDLASEADESTGNLISYMILGGIGLSILYLLLTRAAATGKLALGASNVVRAVVSPTVDPLNPKGAVL